MANSAQARKRARQSVKTTRPQRQPAYCIPYRCEKSVEAVEAGDKAAAQAVYQESVKVIDRIADKGVFHKNKSSPS